MKQEITFDKFVRWTGMGLLVIAILLLVNYLSNVLLPFFIAWLLAYLLYPAVKFIQYKLKVRVRAIAIIIDRLAGGRLGADGDPENARELSFDGMKYLDRVSVEGVVSPEELVSSAETAGADAAS